MQSQETEIAEREITESVALAPPAVRTLVVLVRPREDEPESFDVEYHPVLAIRTRAVAIWWKRSVDPYREPECSSSQEYRKNGWRFGGRKCWLETIIADPSAEDGCGVIDVEDTLHKERYRVVAAPWPDDEDEERLAAVALCLKGDLVIRPRGSIHLEDLLDEMPESPREPVSPPDLKATDRWLRDFLSGGPRPTKEVLQSAREHGYSRDQLFRAKKRIGALAAKSGFGLGAPWHWSLDNEPRVSNLAP